MESYLLSLQLASAKFRLWSEGPHVQAAIYAAWQTVLEAGPARFVAKWQKDGYQP